MFPYKTEAMTVVTSPMILVTSDRARLAKFRAGIIPVYWECQHSEYESRGMLCEEGNTHLTLTAWCQL